MMTIARFEDIVAWQGARTLVRDVYGVTRQGEFSRDFGLRDQIQRAAVSIMSNIAEGFERATHKEFRQFLFVAKASAGEVRSLLYIALDLEYISAAVHQRLAEMVMKLSRQIGNFIKYLETANRS